MSVFVTEIQSLIGSPPPGFEWMEYVIVSIILIWLLNSCVTFVAALFRWIGGGFLD